MSSRPRTTSARSRNSKTSEKDMAPSRPDSTLNESDAHFDPCAATASFFLYAQRNVITVLHHDTLAVERKFERHNDDIQVVCADNVSEKGGGRQIASYDNGQTVIVWDLFTGSEFARFASFEAIRVGAWMRDGNIAFGNEQGNIILFEPATEEHSSTRTIFDPVTALAPASDCRTFAIGYKNGSIIVATLQPSFTILHTLTTSRAPAPIIGLSWHGSSSKQKTDMLATQTADGDLRVWTVSKAPHSEQPRIIRNLGSEEIANTTRNWFAWSKNGRIVVHSDGDTRAWDVRTKRMTNESVPTIDNVVAIASYGPTATLFTVGRNHTVQQYDLISKEVPVMVANVQHVPPNAPPTPPDSIEEQKLPRTVPMKVITSEPAVVSIELEPDTSEDEGPVLSPLQKIAQEMDDLEEERRDQLAPLSPISSRASMSSASSYGRRRRRPGRSSPVSMASSDGTPFSGPSSMHSMNDTVSIRSESSMNSANFTSSRKDIMRSPDETKQMKLMDLFPYTKARLSEVKFRAPQYPQGDVTADILRREMLSVVFGWSHDIESLIRDEQSRHKQGSASGVLLSKWLGESGADAMAKMVASESMTSSDWMLLALNNVGYGAQRQLGEAFVRRSLEANEIHPAVAILLGLGSQTEAIEVYVSRKYYLEAVLLTCLVFPHDWKRQSHLVRKWGEMAVTQGQPELAVRCFSCTGIEPSEPWFSPRSQDMVYQAQQQALTGDMTKSPVSPPSAGSNRMTTKNASLKLITTFGDKGVPAPQESNAFGHTPIANSAVTPGAGPWRNAEPQSARDQSQTRTATPSGYKKARFPSATRQGATDASDAASVSSYQSMSRKATPQPRQATPQPRQATPSIVGSEGPETAIEGSRGIDYLPSPNPANFAKARQRSKSRGESRNRNHHQLHIDMVPTVEKEEEAFSPAHTGSVASRGRHRRSNSGLSKSRLDALVPDDDPISPAQATGNSMKSFKGRSIDRYIESLEEANFHTQQPLGDPRTREASRDGRSRSRPANRDGSRPRADSDVAYIKPGKRSPSSPKSMTAEDAGMYTSSRNADAEGALDRSSVTGSTTGRPRGSSKSAAARSRQASPDGRLSEQPPSRTASRNASRMSNRDRVHNQSLENVSYDEPVRSGRHSPPSPAPMESTPVARSRQRSSSRRTTEQRARSSSRKAQDSSRSDYQAQPSPDMVLEDMSNARPRAYSRKELAAKELENRRLSLARRTPIPQPGEPYTYPRFSPPSTQDDDGLSSRSHVDGYYPTERSHTVDPDAMQRYNAQKTSGTSTSSVPIGLPATPRAMRHPRYMGSDVDKHDAIPAVPALPDGLTALSSYQPGAKEADDIGPLLPSTVYNSRPQIQRSMSTPPERYTGDASPTKPSPRRDSNASRTQKQSRQSSERDYAHPPKGMLDNAELPNIATTLSQGDRNSGWDQVIDVGEEEPPPILAELAHLAGPPPPPPPPTMYQQPSNAFPSGVISIAIDGNGGKSSSNSRHSPPSDDQYGAAMPTSSANTRSRHGSIDSSASAAKNTSKWRNVTDRMRSSSRSHNNASKSPNMQHSTADQYPFPTSSSDAQLPATVYSRKTTPSGPAPYETVVESSQPPPPPPMHSMSPPVGSQHGEGATLLSSSVYRNPKEIRANMPPATLQAGVYQPDDGSSVIEGGMI